jgi:hypothetical protein
MEKGTVIGWVRVRKWKIIILRAIRTGNLIEITRTCKLLTFVIWNSISILSPCLYSKGSAIFRYFFLSLPDLDYRIIY